MRKLHIDSTEIFTTFKRTDWKDKVWDTLVILSVVLAGYGLIRIILSLS